MNHCAEDCAVICNPRGMAMTFVTASSCVRFQSALQGAVTNATLVKSLRGFCSVTVTFQNQRGERFRRQSTHMTATPKARNSRRQATAVLSRSYGKIINGKAIAAEIQKEVKGEIEGITTQRGRPPSLSVVLVGEDPASHVYVRNKIKAAALTGIQSEEIKLPESVSESDLLSTVQNLNRRADVDAILVQLPLPAHIDERRVCDAVTQHKDVDGFHVVHLGQLLCDTDTLLPCTPAAVLEILHRTGIETAGKRVTVVGRSKHVCLPLAIVLQADGSKLPLGGDATVTICHRYTSSRLLAECTHSADIIISGTGVPGLITADMVREGAVVIDAGFSRLYHPDTGKSQLVGDVHFQGVVEKASLITPVPGGVGPVTVAMLMKNTLRLAQQNIVPYSSAIPET